MHNLSIGVWNSSHNTAYNISFDSNERPSGMRGWGWGFGPNADAHAGPDVFDPTSPIRAITKVNVKAGFVASYKLPGRGLADGCGWGHGGQDGIPSHIPGFGTPTLRVYYDRRREVPQNSDVDDFRIATMPWFQIIPEPASFALIALGSLLLLRRRV